MISIGDRMNSSRRTTLIAGAAGLGFATEGMLGYTDGPVLSDKGVAFAKFYTTWHRGPTGRWLVMFDNGYRLCSA